LGRTLKKVVVDTYALIAKATGEITERADRCLKDIREGRILGVIHPLILYEFLLQIYRGRIPIFKSADEALEFLKTYFSIINLENNIVSMAAEIRYKSEELLVKLKRHLSVCDSITIAIAKHIESPILSGDLDLKSVAKKENIKVIW